MNHLFFIPTKVSFHPGFSARISTTGSVTLCSSKYLEK